MSLLTRFLNVTYRFSKPPADVFTLLVLSEQILYYREIINVSPKHGIVQLLWPLLDFDSVKKNIDRFTVCRTMYYLNSHSLI